MADSNRMKSNPVKAEIKIGSLQLDYSTFSIYLAIFIVLLTILIYFIAQRRKNLRKSVLLIGLCESGKTLLFSQLVHNRFVLTHTSIKENIGTYYPQNKNSLKIVDIPGHERLRMRFFDNVKSTARGIIFVIDSLTFQKELKDIAQFLYYILADTIVVKNNPRFLILCNKQDQTLAKSWSVIKAQLEKEINLLRVTESATLDTTSTTASNAFLGKRGKNFEFSHLLPLQVDFLDCSAKGNEETKKTDLIEVEKWIQKIA
uniref:Signal recognition particle receptor subunit beta n=1 Tax=Strigamia maritima TaxID=126957 RepID=T1IJD7_STRMM